MSERKKKGAENPTVSEVKNFNRFEERHKNRYFLSNHDIVVMEVDDLAEELFEWAKQNTSLALRRFASERGIPLVTFLQWVKKYQKLRDAYDLARSLVGCNREEGALKGTLSEKTFLHYQAAYDPEFKEIREWESSLRGKEATQTGQAIYKCIQERFPSDDRVPPLVKGERDGEGNKVNVPT